MACIWTLEVVGLSPWTYRMCFWKMMLCPQPFPGTCMCPGRERESWVTRESVWGIGLVCPSSLFVPPFSIEKYYNCLGLCAETQLQPPNMAADLTWSVYQNRRDKHGNWMVRVGLLLWLFMKFHWLSRHLNQKQWPLCRLKCGQNSIKDSCCALQNCTIIICCPDSQCKELNYLFPQAQEKKKKTGMWPSQPLNTFLFYKIGYLQLQKLLQNTLSAQICAMIYEFEMFSQLLGYWRSLNSS